MSALARETPAEFRLVAAACAWPRRRETRAQVARLARGALDWARVLAMVRRHRVAGLVHDGLRDAGARPPSGIADALAEDAREAARRALILGAETLRLSRALASAGAPVLVLKGATLDRLVYGRPGLKAAWDIDLYTPPEAVETALAALAAAGYARTEPAGLSEAQFRRFRRLDKEAMFANPARDTVVELHWGLTDVPTLLGGLEPFAGAQDVELAPSQTVSTLGPEPLFAYLCVHGARHGWSRLKWIADAAALLGARPLGERARLHDAAVGLGAGRCSGQALLLAEALFGLELPQPLGRALAGDKRVGALAALALDTLLLGGGTQELRHRSRAQDRISLSHFALSGSWRHLAAEARRKMTSAHDFAAVPLPPALDFAYPLLRLPLALRRRWMDRLKGPDRA